jgi:hypothetical protein
MNLRHGLSIYSLTLILFMPGILASTISIAQQTGSETPEAIPAEPNLTPEADAGQTSTGPATAGSTTAPTTARFTPTEKIHADDAVSFPVDI